MQKLQIACARITFNPSLMALVGLFTRWAEGNLPVLACPGLFYFLLLVLGSFPISTLHSDPLQHIGQILCWMRKDTIIISL